MNRINIVPRHTALVTSASVYPVTSTEVKSYLRETASDDDDLITDWIAAATKELETATRRSFVNATYDDVYDMWPLWEGSSAVCHMAPLASVTSITYVDTNGDSQTWGTANYDVDTTSEPGRIRLAYAANTPAIRDVNNAVTVRYVAGYGADATTVPQLAKQWIYLWCQAAYCRRPPLPEERDAMQAIQVTLSYGI